MGAGGFGLQRQQKLMNPHCMGIEDLSSTKFSFKKKKINPLHPYPFGVAYTLIIVCCFKDS